MSTKTYVPTAGSFENQWYLIDAKGMTLGRLAAQLASRLRGKHKPIYTPHLDTGDYFIVINVEEIKVTGNKVDGKIYHHHSHHPGGIKSESFAKLQARKPGHILELAVKGMLPKGPLGRQMFRKLKVFAGNDHPHQAQQPKTINFDKDSDNDRSS